MCEFLDQNGVVLEVGDEIEYWSPSRKDWLKAQIRTIESIRGSRRVKNEQDQWVSEVNTVTKLKVAKEYKPGSYLTYDYMNLTKPANIRKVV